MNHHSPHRQEFKLAEVILGGQDGLVNVLGVILGVAAASDQRTVVLAAGLAATFAESVSMAAVAYTSSMAEADHYRAEWHREQDEVSRLPQMERQEVVEIYRRKGFKGELLEKIVDTITSNKELWVKEMMEGELKLTPRSRADSLRAGFIVGVSALLGSFVPLLPFFWLDAKSAMLPSVIVSGGTLFAIGAYKAKKTVGRPLKSGLEITLIGLISALIGYSIGLLFNSQPS